MIYSAGALLSGALLALAIFLNGELAAQSNPVWSSLVAHFIGTIGSLFLWGIAFQQKEVPIYSPQAPKWTYLAGGLGAFIVVLTNLSVNSNLGLVGTFSLMILGQSLFAILFDLKGWFGLNQKQPGRSDFMQISLILAGSLLIIYS